MYKLAEEMGLVIKVQFRNFHCELTDLTSILVSQLKIIDLESFLPSSEEVRDYFARAQLMEQCERNHAYFERAQG